MTLEYHRPDSLEQALELLPRARPLGGGTALTPGRRELRAVIDLSRLGLDHIQTGERQIEMGAAVRLQALLEADLPAELKRVCRLEAGWNLRNQATLAGTIVSCDGRSPLICAMLAVGSELRLEPGSQTVELDAYLDARPPDRLITSIGLAWPTRLQYEQVARSPADRPQVCLAAASVGGTLRLALGGFGARPLLIGAGWKLGPQAVQQAVQAAAVACAGSDDAWASGEYRAAAAAALARRVVTKVIGA